MPEQLDSIHAPERRRRPPVAGPSLGLKLTEWAGLVLTRFAGVRPRHAAAEAFDLTSSGDPASREAAQALLDQFSSLSGQVHALSNDPWQLLWARDRCAFLPFQERSATLIAWRDPVGPAELSAGLMGHFRNLAARRGKHALLLGVSRTAAEGTAGSGFRHIWLGTEPFYDLATWHTRGPAGEEVRQACNHARRHGGAAREARPLENARDRDAIARVAEEWKSARPERGAASFLRTAPLEDMPNRRYFVVETNRRMESFVVCSSVSRHGQYLQDFVRLPDALRGANELAMTVALSTFGREGLDFVSGGIVPFFDPSKSRLNQETGGAGMLGRVIRHFDRLYRFAGLQHFRAKFVPTRIVDVYALLWPGVITATVAWDIRSLLS